MNENPARPTLESDAQHARCCRSRGAENDQRDADDPACGADAPPACGAENDHAQKLKRQYYNLRRGVLTRADLTPFPGLHSPWAYVRSGMQNR